MRALVNSSSPDTHTHTHVSCALLIPKSNSDEFHMPEMLCLWAERIALRRKRKRRRKRRKALGNDTLTL